MVGDSMVRSDTPGSGKQGKAGQAGTVVLVRDVTNVDVRELSVVKTAVLVLMAPGVFILGVCWIDGGCYTD